MPSICHTPFFVLGQWTGLNWNSLFYLEMHLLMTQVEDHIPYLHPSSCGLLWVGGKPGGKPEVLKDPPYVLYMLVPAVTIDDDNNNNGEAYAQFINRVNKAIFS